MVGGNLYKFLCLCFGLGPAPRIFTNLLKIYIALLRRLNKWQVLHAEGTQYGHSNQCLYEKLEGILQEGINWRKMDDRRSKESHQYIRTNGSQACSFDFNKRKEQYLHSYPDRLWRYPQQTIARH